MKLNRKNKILLVGAVIALYICYEFAFSNTLEYYSTYKSQKAIIGNNLNDPEYLKKLILKERLLNETLIQYAGSTDNSFQNELLKQLSALASRNSLRIIDFKEPHIATDKDIRISSYIFSLEGSFNGILLLINKLENNPSLGYIKNIDFIKKKNYKTNMDYLTAEVILQKSESLLRDKK